MAPPALRPCPQCGHLLSRDARRCTQCGGRQPYRPGAGILLFAAATLALGIAAILETPTPPVPKTAAEIADERRALAVTAVARLIKDSLREPQSVEWISVLADDSADTICLRYRARNGFGGMAVEIVSVAPDGISQSARDWNRRCTASSMFDLSRLRSTI